MGEAARLLLQEVHTEKQESTVTGCNHRIYDWFMGKFFVSVVLSWNRGQERSGSLLCGGIHSSARQGCELTALTSVFH